MIKMLDKRKMTIKGIDQKLYYELEENHATGKDCLKITRKSEKKGYESADLIELEQKEIMETEMGKFGIFDIKIKSYNYNKKKGEYYTMTQDAYQDCNIVLDEKISLFLGECEG